MPDELEPVEGVELGLVLSLELGTVDEAGEEGDVEGSDVEGDVVVGGDADGERSPGRSKHLQMVFAPGAGIAR